jgi:hypothetical protein
MDSIVINFKLLESEKISLNEFLCLLKIYFNNDNVNIDYNDQYSDYQSLENKKYIKIINKKVNEKTEVIYTLRERANILLEKSFNESNQIPEKVTKTVSEKYANSVIDDRVREYRNLFKGLKRGSMGGPEACKAKLIRWLKNNPSNTMDDVIKAASLYIRTLSGNYNYLQQADYFIYKKNGKDETSKLSAFIDELDNDDFVEDGWTDTLK